MTEATCGELYCTALKCMQEDDVCSMHYCCGTTHLITAQHKTALGAVGDVGSYLSLQVVWEQHAVGGCCHVCSCPLAPVG
jgi:hypothetical protein